MKKTIAIWMIALGIMLYGWHVHAQAANAGIVQVTATGLHTQCTVVVGETHFCFASDGLWQSLNGAAYTQVVAGGVVSVNGKTGVVTLAIQ